MNRLFFIAFLGELSTIMNEKQDYLIKLDSVVGDGDLGLTMGDGFNAAYNSVVNATESDIGRLLFSSGKAMASAVPSTMGTLMASGLMQAGKIFKGRETIDSNELPKFLCAYAEGVMIRGKAKPGEKTFIDGLLPAIEKMNIAFENGADECKAVEECLAGAIDGYNSTSTMLAVHGRAATRGESSRKLKDPGAAVAVLIIVALEKSVKKNWNMDQN